MKPLKHFEEKQKKRFRYSYGFNSKALKFESVIIYVRVICIEHSNVFWCKYN